MDEFDLIGRYFAPLATAPFAFGLKDDAAAIPSRPGFDMVVTTDQIAEGVDFFAYDPPGSIAQKALRVNLSDLAAKGAVPSCYLLNIALPQSMTGEWLAGFADGLRQDQALWGLSLIGGDTSRTEGPLSVAITAFGFVPEGAMVRRNGARTGDDVYVTGTIGDSGGGLAIFRREKHTLSEADRDYLVARYRIPQPPLDFAVTLPGIAHAAIDISDGLIADLGHIADVSGVAIVIDAAQVPLSTPLEALWGEAALLRAVTAGDDYQIAFTGPPGLSGPFTRIGHVEAGNGVRLMRDGQVVPVEKPGFRHF
jgi:thiamine-monophosphate kinase